MAIHNTPSPITKRPQRWPWIVIGGFAVLMVISAVSDDASTGTTSSVSSYDTDDYDTPSASYQLEGTASRVDITMRTEDGGTSQLADQPLPFSEYLSDGGGFLYISVQNQGEHGTVTCRITVDGVVVSENTSSGAYTIATCHS
jgi:hypothetical protein